jgi:hypothetical protein
MVFFGFVAVPCFKAPIPGVTSADDVSGNDLAVAIEGEQLLIFLALPEFDRSLQLTTFDLRQTTGQQGNQQ